MTRVYLTIDTECREERLINGRFLPAAGYDLRVWGRFANQARPLGIELIMGELDACNLRGTFYVDPFGAEHFGLDQLAQVCQELRSSGHDVQLHAHPRQERPLWITNKETPPSDVMADYAQQDQAALLQRGIEIFVSCGIPRQEIVSFRAGHFGANNDTWPAMQQVGLLVSSNFNPCYWNKASQLYWPEMEVELFNTGLDVWELPITNFVEPSGKFRHLQITAISAAEMQHLLLAAHEMGIREVTIVTHSFEFYHLDSVERRRGRLNHVNYHRLRQLCRFLCQHQDRFQVQTVGELSRQQLPPRPRTMHRLPRGRRSQRTKRLFEQAWQRIENQLPLTYQWLRRNQQ